MNSFDVWIASTKPDCQMPFRSPKIRKKVYHSQFIIVMKHMLTNNKKMVNINNNHYFKNKQTFLADKKIT